MTNKPLFTRVNLILVLAILAALLIPVMGFAAGQSVASVELFDGDSAENAHLDVSTGTAIACNCGDPGGGTGGGGCC